MRQKPIGIVREDYYPDGEWRDYDGVRFQRTYILVIDDDLQWRGPEHERIVDYATQRFSDLKRHDKELLVIKQLNPSREDSRPAT